MELGTSWNKMLGKQSPLSLLEGMWDFWKYPINGGRWNLSFSGAEFKIHQSEMQLFIAIKKEICSCVAVEGGTDPLRLIAAHHQGARVSIGGISIHVSLISHCSVFDCVSDINRFGEAALFLLYLISISRNCLSPWVLLLAAGPGRGNQKV